MRCTIFNHKTSWCSLCTTMGPRVNTNYYIDSYKLSFYVFCRSNILPPNMYSKYLEVCIFIWHDMIIERKWLPKILRLGLTILEINKNLGRKILYRFCLLLYVPPSPHELWPHCDPLCTYVTKDVSILSRLISLCMTTIIAQWLKVVMSQKENNFMDICQYWADLLFNSIII